jgi:hypothetical protein
VKKILVVAIGVLLMAGFSQAQIGRPQGETLNFPNFTYPVNKARSNIVRVQEPQKKVSLKRLSWQRDFAPRKQIRKTYRPQQIYYYPTYPQPVYDACCYNYQYPWVSNSQSNLPVCVYAARRVCAFPFDILSLLFGGD